MVLYTFNTKSSNIPTFLYLVKRFCLAFATLLLNSIH